MFNRNILAGRSSAWSQPSNNIERILIDAHLDAQYLELGIKIEL